MPLKGSLISTTPEILLYTDSFYNYDKKHITEVAINVVS